MKYILDFNDEQSMKIRNFKWQAHDQQQVMLEWAWPSDAKVKLMLVFPITEEEELEELLESEHEHTVVSRALAASYKGLLKHDRQRFMICPAYFNESNTVVVYQPSYLSDWIYKKSQVSAEAIYKPIRFSNYNTVNLKVEIPPDMQSPLGILRYAIYENSRLQGEYPVDNETISGNYSIYLRKSQQIKFLIDEEHSNRFEII